jgi:hypothetical protein
MIPFIFILALQQFSPNNQSLSWVRSYLNPTSLLYTHTLSPLIPHFSSIHSFPYKIQQRGAHTQIEQALKDEGIEV